MTQWLWTGPVAASLLDGDATRPARAHDEHDVPRKDALTKETT